MDVQEPDLLQRLLHAKDPYIRAAAVRVLRQWQADLPNASKLLRERVEDEHPRVRLEAVLACGFSSAPEAAEIAQLAKKHPVDDGMQHALTETLRFLNAPAPDDGKPVGQRNRSGGEWTDQMVRRILHKH